MESLQKVLRSRLSSAVARQYAEIGAVFLLLALTVVGEWDLLRNEITLGSDAATQYYPFYYLLGEILRSGSIPAWNPYQFSGTPFAADPLTGWTYLPAMLLFSFLPIAAAVKGLMFSHLLLAGLFTYTLARVLGMGTQGALLAAVAYEYSGLFYVQNTCCLQYIGVMSWLPLALLGAELAIRSSRWLNRALWWGVSGLALSQILASWFVQGSYYALLALGGYIFYRALLFPPDNARSIGGRVVRCVVDGGAVLLFGFSLAAAGILPRLEFNKLSNLAGGYPSDIRVQGGWSLGDWSLLLEPGFWYAGLTVVALALVAPLIARRRFAVPYFAVLSVGALVLTGQGPTPLHSALYLLPYFERLHPHDPDRVLVVFYLGAALLAGSAVTVLGERAGRKPLLLALPVLAALLLAAIVILFPPKSEGWVTLYSLSLKNGMSIPVGSLLFLFSAVVLVAAYALIPERPVAWRGLAFVMLTLVVFADLLAADRTTTSGQDFGGEGWIVNIGEVDLAEYYRPSGTARFLQSKSGEEPFRYFSYDPGLGESSHVSSPARFAEPNSQALEANSRSMLMGLQSLQGYNPTHISRYDEYMTALNGSDQEYHFLDVYEGGLNSPLLDLLNARYLIVPTHPSKENPQSIQHFEQFERTHPVVYEDDQSKVLENPQALPRAWIVHSAQRATPEEALDLLSSGEIEPRETVLLEDPPTGLAEPDDASAERASITEYGSDGIQVETTTGAPGLLMLGEVYYPAWKAYVDGEPAPLYRADHLFRAVPVPAGEHTVELRYESRSLRAGTAISLLTVLALLALTAARLWGKRLAELRLPDKLRKGKNDEQEPKVESNE